MEDIVIGINDSDKIYRCQAELRGKMTQCQRIAKKNSDGTWSKFCEVVHYTEKDEKVVDNPELFASCFCKANKVDGGKCRNHIYWKDNKNNNYCFYHTPRQMKEKTLSKIEIDSDTDDEIIPSPKIRKLNPKPSPDVNNLSLVELLSNNKKYLKILEIINEK